MDLPCLKRCPWLIPVVACGSLLAVLASIRRSKFEQLILHDLWLLLMRILLLQTATVPQSSYLPSRRNVTDADNSTGDDPHRRV